MKTNNKILVLIAALFLWSCGPKAIVTSVSERVGPGYNLFSRAEKKFHEKSYDKALEIYNVFLSRFPDSPLADAALIKIGAIHTEIGNNANARNIYKRLIDEYPDSVFVPDAMVEILFTFYNECNYEEVIRLAAEIQEKCDSRIHILRTYILLADTYTAIGSPVDAAYFYTMAYNKSKVPEKEAIIVKLKEAVRQLDSPDIISLLKGLQEDDLSRAYLMFQLGLKRADEEKYSDAVRVLSEFVERFPEHENSRQAKSLIEEINKKSLHGRFTIGCLLPLSGPYKHYGNKALKGIELAMGRFNSKDNHPSIRIIIKDIGSDPHKTAMAVMELFNEGAAAIIGPIITAEPAALEAQDRGIPIITLTQKDNITDIGNYVFRNFLTPKMQVKAIVSYAVRKLGLNSFAILYPDENYGTTFMNLFWDEVMAYGGKVVGVESYDPAHTDFADPIKKLVGLYFEVPEDLKDVDIQIGNEEEYNDTNEEADDADKKQDKNPDEEIYNDEEPKPLVDFDAIFIPDAPNKAGLIIPQLAFYDVDDVYLFGTNLWHSDRLIKMSRQYIQGAIMADGFFAESSSEHVRDFVRFFKETFMEEPGFIEAVSYDTAMILFQILSAEDIRFRSELKDQLMKLVNFRGITGVTSFDNNGDVQKKPYLLKIKGEKFIEIK